MESLTLWLSKVLKLDRGQAADTSDSKAAAAAPASPGLRDEYFGAADRLRDTTKWMITSLALVGTLFAAGSQLSDLGAVEAPWRLALAFLAAALVLAGVVYAIVAATAVFLPLEAGLSDLKADQEFKQYVRANPDVFRERATDLDDFLSKRHEAITAYREARNDTAGKADPTSQQTLARKKRERDAVRQIMDDVLAKGYYFRFDRRYKKAARSMVIGGLAAGLGAIVFAYAAHPPPKASAQETSQVIPVPAVVRVSLSSDGRQQLTGLLGRSCTRRTFRALAIDGTEPDFVLVTSPAVDAGCRPARFKLDRERGNAVPVR
jgi:hypothetical protein